MGISLKDIKKEDLARFILVREKISEEELASLILQQLHGDKVSKAKKAEQIPVSIFNAGLFPLEAITRYMRENLGKGTGEIAGILGKSSPSISLAYKKAAIKKFSFSEKGMSIPLGEFERNHRLSVLEIVVSYLKKNDLRFTEIAAILGRDVRTVWTVNDRAVKKSAERDKRQKK